MSMTHKVSTGKGSWLFVEVPEGAHRFYSKDGVVRDRLGMDVMERREDGTHYFANGVALPPGSYTFIGTTKDISEEQCRGIVDMSGSDKIDLFNDYRQGAEVWLMTATESLRSLMISNNLSPELNYAILKQTNG